MRSKWIDYNAYIKSQEWQALRKDVLAFRGRSCMVCKSVKRVQVHHMHYGNLGNEKLKDLLVLCGGCHIQLHKQARIGSKQFSTLNCSIAEGLVSVQKGKFFVDGQKQAVSDFRKSVKKAKPRSNIERLARKKRSQRSRVAEAKRHQENKVYNPFLGTWKSVSV